MDFGVFSVLDHYPQALPRTGQAFLNEFLEQAAVAEELGYRSIWTAEHHFDPYGLCPNPAVLLAAAAARTQRVRLGVSVSILPLRHPLQVAEDYALLDVLSGGRLNLGVGSGYLKHEFEPIGVPLEDKAARMDEALEILLSAWRGESVDVEGRYHRVRQARLQILPLQRPRPPVWIAVLRREAAYHVGRKGLNMMGIPYVTVDGPGELKEMIDAFRAGYAESGAPADALSVPMGLHVHVAETREEARRVAQPALELYLKTRKYARGGTFDGLLEKKLIAVGTPDDVAATLREYEAAGTTHLMCLMNFGGMPHQDVLASMQLFAREVMPRFRGGAAPGAA